MITTESANHRQFFDYTKLKWMNGEYIKAMDFDSFYEKAEPYIREVITKDLDLKKIAAMVKPESRYSRISKSILISLRHFRNMMWQCTHTRR